MNKYEKKIIDWLEKYSIELGIIAVFILGLAVRWAVRNYVSDDATIFLLRWYDIVKENGGIKSLRQQVGDYTILYQFFIALFTYLPVEPLFNYKILSGIFDVFLVGISGLLVWKITDKDRWKTFMVVAGLYLSPLVVFNSACWGQCDSIYTFFCIIALYMILEERYTLAFCAYGVAFAFKLQAIFMMPFVLLYYVRSKKFSVTKFIYITVMVLISGLPALVQGRGIGDIIWIYGNQVQEYSGGLVYNYPSFWNIFYDMEFPQYVDILSGAAMVMTVGVLLGIVIWAVNRNMQMTKYNCIWMAMLLSYACVLFLPTMHERYGYLCEILALLIVVLDKKTVFLVLPMYLCSFFAYGYYLFGVTYNIRIVSVINLLVFVGYCIYFNMHRERDDELVA